MTDAEYMRIALSEARLAAAEGEVPVGAVLLRGGTVLAQAHNRVEQTGDPTAHAELLCLQAAAAAEGAWRMADCTLYVTLEPCPMCAGAIINSRIENLYFGAYDKKSGCAGSVINLFESGMFNHNVNVTGGITEDKCASILTEFFRELRKKK